MNVDVKKFLCLTIISLTTLTSFADNAAQARIFGDNDCIMITKKIKAYKGVFNHLCADNIKSKKICTDDLSVNRSVNLDSLCVRDLCVTEAIRTKEVCGLYRATATLSADTVYVLGTDINLDTIIDDPNGNTLTGPFQYIAPASGYYSLTVQADANALTGASVILGVPVSVVEIYINNVLVRQDYRPFLTFHNEQRSTLSGLISLKAADVVTIRFKVIVLDDIAGTIDYVGTMVLLGDGTEVDRTLFKIHYLSSDCTPVDCGPCMTAPCDNTCMDICHPCND